MVYYLDEVVLFLLYIAIGIIELFICVPRLAAILLGNLIPSLHSTVTSDIPGNPHAFDNCIISLFRTLPEPSNFNIVWTSLPLSTPLIIRGAVPPSRVNSISLYGKGSAEPPSSLDIEKISTYALEVFLLQRS
jgi:hypothetical protein